MSCSYAQCLSLLSLKPKRNGFIARLHPLSAIMLELLLAVGASACPACSADTPQFFQSTKFFACLDVEEAKLLFSATRKVREQLWQFFESTALSALAACICSILSCTRRQGIQALVN